MAEPVAADGAKGSKSWDMTSYWRCPRCKAEVEINQRDRDYLICPECNLSGEIMVKWES